jgi:hypothetical protein
MIKEVRLDRRVFCIVTCLVVFLGTEKIFAAPVLYRVQQQKAMKQRQAQEMYMYEHGMYQQQQAQAQAQAQGQQAPPTYQQTVDQRNQAIAQAIRNAHDQSATNAGPQADNNGTDNPAQPPSAGLGQPTVPDTSSGSKEVVDLSEVWKKLDKKSTVWQLLMDDQSKLLTVSEYLDRYRKQGVKINAPPAHYVQMLDQIASSNPQMLQRPFGELLQVLAIVDYDFDNGIDKDQLARHVLGDAGFEENKKRFTQQQQQPQQH